MSVCVYICVYTRLCVYICIIKKTGMHFRPAFLKADHKLIEL